MTLENIQKNLDTRSPLKLQKITKAEVLKECKTVTQFIRRFITYYNERFCTIYIGNSHVQTHPRRTRTAHDMYRIVKYYFPKVTYRQIQKILTKFAKQGELIGECCSTVEEHVYSLYNVREGYALMGINQLGETFKEKCFHDDLLSSKEHIALKAKYKEKKVQMFY